MLPSHDEAHRAVAARLSPAALAHSERVAETAAAIAKAYGMDPDAARVAGLLHDWHRETPGEELLARARELGIPVTDVDESVTYLLHGPVAARDLAEVFPGIAEDITAAVGAHTYGSVSMTPLAKIVYVADVLEPGRRHARAEALREQVGVMSLDRLFAATYAASVRHLVDTGRRIHPHTVAVWNRHVAGDRP
ncbi:MAG: bis(5'-nucleosyl)-tetraphosphatase (symmetrical) YqeK [Coriobacteriia bacterium]|nr:bis(5'-nucleosyl)-tetraphosphatase (symmetrical) YqeK [Coriobacteriia bacterium]